MLAHLATWSFAVLKLEVGLPVFAQVKVVGILGKKLLIPRQSRNSWSGRPGSRQQHFNLAQPANVARAGPQVLERAQRWCAIGVKQLVCAMTQHQHDTVTHL